MLASQNGSRVWRWPTHANPLAVQRGGYSKGAGIPEGAGKHRLRAEPHQGNVQKILPEFSDDQFWEAMLACLLTTQQRSGSKSAVTRFLIQKPYPLCLSACRQTSSVQQLVESTLTAFGDLRRAKNIGEEGECNLRWLQGQGWSQIHAMVRRLKDGGGVDTERQAVDLIIDNMAGFGPKQSRNLLQSLGLTQYEIPIDSRITKWLVAIGFPVHPSAASLADRHYYSFVMQGFQALCAACNVLPCVMDAAIFSSFDDEWTEDRLVW